MTRTNHVWQRNDVGTFVPSPVVYQGRVYLVRDKGEVDCIDPETGKTLWTDAFPRARAAFYASPLIAGGIMYAPREDGVVFVGRVSDGAFEFLGKHAMDEPVIGSPVPAWGRLLVRGEEHLFCFASKK